MREMWRHVGQCAVVPPTDRRPDLHREHSHTTTASHARVAPPAMPQMRIFMDRALPGRHDAGVMNVLLAATLWGGLLLLMLLLTTLWR